MERRSERSECSIVKECKACTAARGKPYPVRPGLTMVPEMPYEKMLDFACTALLMGASVLGAIVRTRVKGKQNGSNKHGRRG